MTLASLLNAWADVWSRWFVASILEATILLAVVGVFLLLVRRSLPAAAAHLLLMLVLAKALFPFGYSLPHPELSLWQSHSAVSSTTLPVGRVRSTVPAAKVAAPVPVGSPTERIETAVTAAATPPTIAAQSPMHRVAADTPAVSTPPRFGSLLTWRSLNWQAIAMLVWFAVLVALFLRVLISQRRLWRALAQSPLAADGKLVADVHSLAAQLGLRRQVQVLLGPESLAPAVSGTWRPVLILPRDLASRLSEPGWRWVVLHELAHVRRGDLAWLGFSRLVECAAWFNPVVWLAARWAEHFRECACDELALRHAACDRATCGEAFVELLAGAAAKPRLSIGFLSAGRLTRRRLLRLVDPRQTAAHRGIASFVIACVAVCALLSVNQPRTMATDQAPAQSADETDDAPKADPPSTESPERLIKDRVWRIWEQHSAPMETGRVRWRTMRLSSLKKDRLQQGHELAERSKDEVETLLDSIDFSDPRSFRNLRDALLVGNLILDQPAYYSYEITWDRAQRRLRWTDGRTYGHSVIHDGESKIVYNPDEQEVTIHTSRQWPREDFAQQNNWALSFEGVLGYSSALRGFENPLMPSEITIAADGTARVFFSQPAVVQPTPNPDLSFTWTFSADRKLERVDLRQSGFLRELDFREYPGGVLLPRVRVRTVYPTYYSENHDPRHGPLLEISVTMIEHAEINVDIPPEEFRMSVPANTAVWDRRGPLKLRAAEVPTEDVLTLFER